MTGIETLLDGFRKFREMYFEKAPGLYRDLLRHGHAHCGGIAAMVRKQEGGEAVAAGNLNLHGWYLNIFEGALELWNPDTGTFERLS